MATAHQVALPFAVIDHHGLFAHVAVILLLHGATPAHHGLVSATDASVCHCYDLEHDPRGPLHSLELTNCAVGHRRRRIVIQAGFEST